MVEVTSFAGLRLRPIRPGDRIGIVATAGPVPEDRLRDGIAILEQELGVTCVLADNVLDHGARGARHGYLAGSDEQRVASLEAMVKDPGIAAIWCARGGYGTTRVLAQLDAQLLREHPKPLVGFSDVTALLCWAQRAGLPGLHGPVVSQIATLREEDRRRLWSWLRGELPLPLVASASQVLGHGQVLGRLIPGNLEVLRSLLGTPWFPNLRGAILALEEIGEAPYRIDRMLTQLLTSGALADVTAVAVGQLFRCEAPAGIASPSALEVIWERLQSLSIPMVTGFPFGHDPQINAALPFGLSVRLDADAQRLEFLEPLCSRA